jgi:hypothetical protein
MLLRKPVSVYQSIFNQFLLNNPFLQTGSGSTSPEPVCIYDLGLSGILTCSLNLFNQQDCLGPDGDELAILYLADGDLRVGAVAIFITGNRSGDPFHPFGRVKRIP